MTRFKSLRLALSALLLAALLSAPIAAAENKPPSLSVCVDADNPPFSAADGVGIDVDIARALGEVMQRELVLHSVIIPARGGLGKALRTSLQAGLCEVFMGLPEESELARELAERNLKSSRPYLVIGYLLVTGAKTGAAAGSRVGAVTATPADLYLHRQKLDRVPYGNNRELIDALRSGAVRSALVWTPALARYGKDAGDGMLGVEARQPMDASLRTGLVVAIRSDGLAVEVDRGLAALAASGRLAAIADAHGLRFMPPI